MGILGLYGIIYVYMQYTCKVKLWKIKGRISLQSLSKVKVWYHERYKRKGLNDVTFVERSMFFRAAGIDGISFKTRLNPYIPL